MGNIRYQRTAHRITSAVNCRPLKPSPRSICPAAPYPTGVHIPGIRRHRSLQQSRLPRLDDFCWIATQETNVYGGLAVALPFIHTRPGYFGHVMSELLFWIARDKLLFGSDYGIWT